VAEIEIALQRAYVARLKGHAPVAAIVGTRIYDGVPQDGAQWPHIEIGAIQVIEDGHACQDEAAEVFTTLHGWSDAVGRVEARMLAAAIRSAFTDWSPDLSAHGLACIDHKWTESRDVVEADGKITHLIFTLRALVEARD
jgi:hypothetical protein